MRHWFEPEEMPFLLYFLLFFLSFFACFAHDAPEYTVSSLSIKNLTNNGALRIVYKYDTLDPLACDRVHLSGSGISRLKFSSYASSVRVTLVPILPDSSKLLICSHRNFSLQLCHCKKYNWERLHKGIWSSTFSPYEDIYIDVLVRDDMMELFSFVTLTAKEDFQSWRLIRLAIGIAFLLLAPIVSNYVRFWYGIAMVIAVLYVLFKKLPMFHVRYRNWRLVRLATALTIYLLAWIVGDYVPSWHEPLVVFAIAIICQKKSGKQYGCSIFVALSAYQFGRVARVVEDMVRNYYMMVTSILVSFGIAEKMVMLDFIVIIYGNVAVIALAGVALVYYIWRRIVMFDEWSADMAISKFVKLAMRIAAITLILQGSTDTLLSLATLLLCLALCFFLRNMKRICQAFRHLRKFITGHNCPEILSEASMLTDESEDSLNILADETLEFNKTPHLIPATDEISSFLQQDGTQRENEIFENEIQSANLMQTDFIQRDQNQPHSPPGILKAKNEPFEDEDDQTNEETEIMIEEEEPEIHINSPSHPTNANLELKITTQDTEAFLSITEANQDNAQSPEKIFKSRKDQ